MVWLFNVGLQVKTPLRTLLTDTGAILAYRPAIGFGIRLDEGFATSGGLDTPHYDSLLVKVTALGNELLYMLLVKR